MASAWRVPGVSLASGLVLVGAACHSGLRMPRDAAVEQPREIADGQGADDVRAAADAALADTVDAIAVDARWTIPDGLGPICLTTTTTTVWGWADVLALVDRSSSMGLSMAGDEPCAPAGTHCTTRWDAVRSALLNLVPWQSHVRWGTLVFPSPGAESCAVGPTPQVPVMENAADAIGRAMSSVAPGGESPTGAAIRAAVAYLGDLADRDVKGIVLFTDGEPGCGGVDGGAAWAEALDAAAAAEAQGYPLFVFGLGPNPGDLDRLARAGGTDLYYPATSGQQLDDALGSIFWNPGDFVRSCSFATYEPPPDPTRVYVFLNGEPIPRDSNDGWSFGSQNSYIVLNGESCERLQSLDAVELAILFGCGDAGSP